MNHSYWADPPNDTAFPIEKAGYPFIFAAAFVTAVFALLELVVPAILGLLACFAICAFFRNPDRLIPCGQGVVVSPADGRVVAVRPVSNTPFYEGSCVQIGIFMSVFNVHVNRIPYEGRIARIDYKPGQFINAGKEKASTLNEHNAVSIETEKGSTICFVQVAGLIARRIICRLQTGQAVERGKRFGLICFGSRVDVYLPAEAVTAVKKGDRVQSGSTIIAHLT